MKKILFFLSGILLFISKDSSACVAQFWYYTQSINPPIVVFYDSTSTGIFPISYSWDFGDGTTDTSSQVTHTFPAQGTYNVCLITTDSAGCSDTVCYNVAVLPPVPTVAAYLIVDSMSMYSCTAPASSSFYYYTNIQGYSTTDSVLFEINYGDGVDSIFYMQLSNSAASQGIFTHSYMNAGNYTAQFTITAPGNVSDSVTAGQIIVSASCGAVSGTVYNDLNGNCTYDSGEELSNVSLTIYDGSNFLLWTNSDVNGLYSFNVPSGTTYTIQVSASNGYNTHLSPSCPPSGTITVGTVPSTGNDFGLICPPGFDLQGNISGWGFRPGFVGSVCVFAYNQRCNTPNGQIEITFPPELTPLPDSSGSGYTINGNVVTYPISSPDLYWSICIPVSVSVNAQIGDSVCIDMNILPVTGDSVPSNNSGTFCFLIRGSYDPNDKYVTPAGEGPTGLIRPNTDLTYTIRFQNTGNAEALNVYILDSLNAYLDAPTAELIGASHNVSMSLLTGNILRFNFDNINLADSNTSEPASHGYVSYRIKQINNVPQLSQVTNTAGIYFDFNPPIITNTTLNTVDYTLSVPVVKNHSSLLNIYPNPANGKCYLYFTDNSKKSISISDVTNKIVFKTTISGESFILNTEKFAEGFYTIRVLDEHNQSEASKLIIVH